jgi:hypothetical protein
MDLVDGIHETEGRMIIMNQREIVVGTGKIATSTEEMNETIIMKTTTGWNGIDIIDIWMSNVFFLILS